MELTITSYVMYYNKIVFSRFLRDNLIQPEILMLDFDLVSHMTENAFNDGPFEKVHSLTISNLRIESLGPNSFVGLNSLQYLALQDIHLTSIPDCLHGVASSLNEIVIIAAITNRAMYRFNGLLSGVMLTALQHVELKLNLQNSVIGDPFKSTRLLTIDLSMCKIEFIHSDAFITIQDSVQQINLSGNELKTLPTGMFSYLLPRESLVIDLTNNPWDCECHLSELRKNLRMYEKNFSPNSVCDTPAEFNGLAIKNASFCGKQTGNVTEDDPTVNFMVVQCLSQQSGKWFSEMVVRHREIKFNVVHDLDTADVALHIYPNDDGEQKRMVAFSALQQTGIQVVNYHCKCENIPIALNQRLRKAVYYTLCVQDKSTRMTIAQNCMAFQLGNRHLNVWKTSNHRLLTIFVLIGIYLLMIFFGGIIMVILYGRFVSVPLRIAQNTCNSVGWDCRLVKYKKKTVFIIFIFY